MRRSPRVFFNHLLQTPLPNLSYLQVYPHFQLYFSITTKVRVLNTVKTQSYLIPNGSKPLTTITHCSNYEINKPHKEFTSVDHSRVIKSVILKCSYLWNDKNETFIKEEKLSLQELLLKLSDISPETIRPFWRVSGLLPEDVLDILRGFEFDSGNPAVELRKVGLLWKLFKWDFEGGSDFDHVPESYEIMGLLLTQVRLLRDAEKLLQLVESRGVILGCGEIFCRMIEGYVSVGELENAIITYNLMRSRGLVPSQFCYQVLLNLLTEMNQTKLAFQVHIDMVEMGFILSNENETKTIFEEVTSLLCKEMKIQEARTLVKKVTTSRFEPSGLVINMIADGYCEKKDFDDLMSFLSEMKCAPDTCICNKIISFVCKNYGTGKAHLFAHELECTGFKPNESTFGILISYSCREGKVKDAFIYLSEILSRCLKPDLHSYNALMSALFKEGMWKHVKNIYDEMVERGTRPDLSTFKVLLAGYCKFRKFDKVKEIIGGMVKQKLVQLSPLEDPLSMAFTVLGFDPSSVKVKRDNNADLWKAEFFDTLGNGLYLDTDTNEYENRVMAVLDDSILPNFNLLIVEKCDEGDLKAALMLKNNIIHRGEKLSLAAYSALMKTLCLSHSHAMTAIHIFDEMPEQARHLDQDTYNLFIRVICKRGTLQRGRLILENMLLRDLSVENETYSTLISGLCMKGNPKELLEFWNLARKYKWLPTLNDCKGLMRCLCQKGMLKETIEILESILETCPQLISDVKNIFVKELCDTGYTSIAHIFVEEILRYGWVSEEMVYSNLLQGFCKEQQFQEAFGILERLLEKKMTLCLDVYRMLTPLLCKSFRLENAMDLKEIMLKKEPAASLSVYYTLIKSLWLVQQVAQATLQFREMLMKGFLPEIELCNVMLEGNCQDKNIKKVRELLSIMVRKKFSLTISSYRHIVRLMCTQGMVIQALSLKELMSMETEFPPLILHNVMIFHLLQSGYSSLVSLLLDKMQRKGLVLDVFTYNFLVYGYSKCKDVSRSVEALESMIDKNLRPSNRSLRIVIGFLCSENGLDKAVSLSRVMEGRGWMHGSIVQNAIVEGFLFCGKFWDAEYYLRRLEEKGLIPNNINYDILIKSFCSYGRVSKAIDVLNIMLKKGNLPSPTSYDSIIQGFCTGKSLDEALNFHSEMLIRKFMPSIRSWNALVIGLCKTGRSSESEMLLDSMFELGQIPTWDMYQSVIDRYCLENNLNKASQLLNKMQQSGHVPDFKSHWSVISNLSNSNDKDSSESEGFLSNLLSRSGFTRKNNSMAR
ncbi:hypothetical protein GIB67_011982 [Kingdonia uniflora]|uniref:Pentatricopeptide repeat-containing protein n=1 Tax=Kingdonia uniflora TaxID=39325 RepID=A0A7J7M021_9MAGN|nr:hypothetical protein GIB67_011982 [Kingdonia uniflora]